MSRWIDAVDPMLVHRLFRRAQRPGLSPLAHVQRIHARHHTLAARSALADRLASRGRMVGEADVPIVYARAAGAKTTDARSRPVKSATSTRGAPAPARPRVAVANRTSTPVVQRKALHGPRPAVLDAVSQVPSEVPPPAPVTAASLVAASNAMDTPQAVAMARYLPRESSPQDRMLSSKPAMRSAQGALAVEPGPHRRLDTGAPHAASGFGSDPQSMSAGGLDGLTALPLVTARRGPPSAAATPAPAAPNLAAVLPVVGELLDPGARPATIVQHELARPLPLAHPVAAAAPVDAAVDGRQVQVEPSSGVPPTGRERSPDARGHHVPAAATPVTVDVDRLADAVQTKLLRRLAIERERRGGLR